MRILSGIQPSGGMHIGNYLGAVKYWEQLQNQHSAFFCVVDLHALTTMGDAKELKKAITEKVIELLAVGINPEKATLFIQSHVKEHTELAWILNTITPISELERMTQFKDKAKKQKQNINAGLFTYPTLMAADILLYQTDAVPVGKDQAQHLELTRSIAKKFNSKFGKTFKEPETIIPKIGARIMSLTDPKKKMSKSDKEDSYIGLFDEPAVLKKKIAKAVTDTGREIRYDVTKKPGVSNLLSIYSLFSEEPIKELEVQFKGKGYGSLKQATTKLLVDRLEPFRKQKKALTSRDLYIEEILKKGGKHASSIAEDTMEDVRKKIGLVTF